MIIRYGLIAWLSLGSVNHAQAELADPTDFFVVYYQPTKANVLRVLDKMEVEFELDADGDVDYVMNDKGWRGYVVFQSLGEHRQLWNIQLKAQFSTKAEYYNELVKISNQWNSQQLMPKAAMKTPTKLVLSVNYPVQYGFNPSEFKTNVFQLFNREVERFAVLIEGKR